jgi:hypothetical protein
MGQCLNGPYSHWPTPTLRLQLHCPDVYFALLAVRQRDPLKHLCLCRIAVNRLSQSLHRQFVRDSQRQLADHLPGVRRHQCRPDDLAGPFAGVEGREPLLFTINECPLHLRKFQPVCVQGDTLLGRPDRGQANGGYLGVSVGAVRDDQIARRAARSVHSVSNAQPRRRHRRVRVLFRERNVAGGVDGRVARPQGRIGLHAPVPYSYFGGLQPQVFYVRLALGIDSHGLPKVQDEGKLDNTLIIYISGDNGTSAEGTLEGTFNQMTAYNGILTLPEPLQLLHYENWGSEKTYPHMSVAWSWAFDTPFKWTKQVASHFGGTRQGMAISWPGHISDVGGIRTQFHHMIDVVPTILEAAGIPAPDIVNGIKQKPIEGASMAYTFDKANANAPSKRDTQYFEMVANRAIYHDGWIAATTPPAAPWLLATGTLPDVNNYNWELYNIGDDYSESNDLAAKMPDKLKEMQALFTTEAAKYQVLPLDNSFLTRAVTPRPSAVAGKTVFTYTGENAGIPVGNAPSILDKDFTITAEVTIPEGGASGMIVTMGGVSAAMDSTYSTASRFSITTS